jgi:hypothetical protein
MFHSNPITFFSALKLKNLATSCFYNCPQLKTLLTPNAVADGHWIFHSSPNVDCVFADKLGEFYCDFRLMNDDFESYCGNCPKCKGTFPNCLQKGRDFAGS